MSGYQPSSQMQREKMPMPVHRFEDGAAYDQLMGHWTRLIGAVFLDWLAPRPGLRWIDIGCGSGAFTELIVERCAPTEVQAIDPSEDQVRFARVRRATRLAEFRQGDAMALPFAKDRFDAAVMALVIFFVPDPVKSVAEMARVVRPDGTVAAYAWDMFGGGFALEPILIELRQLGVAHPQLPSVDASRMEVLMQLWEGAGLQSIETREITAQRTFADFNDFWSISLRGSNVGRTVAALPSDQSECLKERVRARLPADATGRVTYSARVNAIKGRVPAQG
jgi:ubiquinone/menaquinone biosynthesis C-methylase UbiE